MVNKPDHFLPLEQATKVHRQVFPRGLRYLVAMLVGLTMLSEGVSSRTREPMMNKSLYDSFKALHTHFASHHTFTDLPRWKSLSG